MTEPHWDAGPPIPTPDPGPPGQPEDAPPLPPPAAPVPDGLRDAVRAARDRIADGRVPLDRDAILAELDRVTG